MFWGLRLFVSPTPAPGHAVAVVDPAPARGDLSRLFGVQQVAQPDAPPPESTRFKLIGVMAARGSEARTPGVALVSVDDKPARPYRAGARIEERVFLREVSARGAAFGPETGPVAFTLEVPRLPDPATGTLTPVDPAQLQVDPPPARVADPPPPAPPPPPVEAPQAQPSDLPGAANRGDPAAGGPSMQRGGSGGPPGPNGRQ